jgi:hypothetical protein
MVAERMLLDGLAANASTFQAAVLDGAPRTVAEIRAVLQSRLDAAQAVQTARAAWLAAVDADRATRARTRAYVAGIRQILMAGFGGEIHTLAAFGLTPRAQHVRSPEEKIAVAAKGAATRAARHTMGPRQREKIQGIVPIDEATAPDPDEPSGT